MRRAVFLDRDGTIIKERDVLRGVKELRLLRGVALSICTLKKMGFLVIVVTNQPVVARGWLTEQEVEKVHTVLVSRLKRKNANIDAIYYCPHHPEANLQKYRKKCSCRKPNIGMIKQAQKKFSISLKKSFIVGDSTRDILAGNKAGLKTILVKTGYAGKDGKYTAKPDFVAKNLMEAVKIVKNDVK